MQKKHWIIAGSVAGVALLLLILWWALRKDLSDHIVIPYIAHQAPHIDPHLPDAVALSDKLDEVLFDGLFNISANPSGITYEDGLGELIDIDDDNVVTIRLNTKKKWHSSFQVLAKDKKVTISEGAPVYFSAADLNFTLKRIQQLGSLSPDYILVSQALKRFEFEGPDANNEVRFTLKGDRIWTEPDIKEVFSFKIIPHTSDPQAGEFQDGSGPYLAVAQESGVPNFVKNPAEIATISHVDLRPFIDNSTFTTELKNGNINTLLNTPFGGLSPILKDPKKFFTKSNISTTFFAVLFNTQRLSVQQRRAFRGMVKNQAILNRFFKVNTEQQRHITDYKGNSDNYSDYLNFSVFPSSTYYVEEEIIIPSRTAESGDVSLLPDSLTVVACPNYGHREEYLELLEIFNDKSLFSRPIHAREVQKEEIARGNYDALLIAIDGYKSTFLFDLYNIFLRAPDLAGQKINLITESRAGGETVAAARSLLPNNNFCRLDAVSGENPDHQAILKLLENVYGFMAANYIGDKQVYAQLVDRSVEELALGAWLFSMPSLAYFSTQFDDHSIDLYGVASQLSTIEKWRERPEK